MRSRRAIKRCHPEDAEIDGILSMTLRTSYFPRTVDVKRITSAVHTQSPFCIEQDGTITASPAKYRLIPCPLVKGHFNLGYCQGRVCAQHVCLCAHIRGRRATSGGVAITLICRDQIFWALLVIRFFFCVSTWKFPPAPVTLQRVLVRHTAFNRPLAIQAVMG